LLAHKQLTLADFYFYDPKKGNISDTTNPLSKIENPGQRNDTDFKATLKGLKKNLIIFDEFIGDNRYDEVYERIKANGKRH